ncbi:Ig-like domain repeat protein [Edaphobacter aggregans]|uniref:Ig-like domain repeat protein n=1 Tax=Edaphobacter aggregans TaxID=570835 RepID=UPI00055512D2|nr:Ig-like domain repeat protein [Edaphobacter aggregans]
MAYPRTRGYEVATLAAIALLLFPSLLFSQVAAAPAITRWAGGGPSVFNGDQGLAASINLNAPTVVLLDATGNQYLSDTGNNCVRRIDPSGNITTIAGLDTSDSPDTCDIASNLAPSPSQGLSHPTGLALDAAGRLYIADSLHHCIRSLAPGSTGTASLTTVAGTCGADASASITPNPQGLALDSSGNLYVASQSPGTTSSAPAYQVIRHAASFGPSDACLIAGTPSAHLTLCPNISGIARLDHPTGLAFDSAANNLYIADTGNQCVRILIGLAALETAAGQCASDGTGTSLTTLRNPYGLALTPTGSLLITQSSPDTVVSLAPGATALTLIVGLPNGAAGPYTSSQDGAPATSVPLYAPRGLAVDRLGAIVLADSGNNILRRLAPTLAPLTIDVSSASRLYGSPNPEFTGTVTGALPTEKIGDTLVITYSTAATARSASGRYAITATVSGPSAASYAVTIHPGTLEIDPAATSTALNSSSASPVAGSTVTFSASVTSAAGTPAGVVAFYDNGTKLLGTSTLSSAGAAFFSTSSLAVGDHVIAAIFRDTANYTTSAAVLDETITAATGSFTLAASQPVPAARSAGQSVYQLTLNSIGIFSGTVAFSCGGLPAGGSCAFSSNPTLAPGSAANVTLTITTPTTHASLAQPSPTAGLAPLAATAVFPFELPALGVLLSTLRRRKRTGGHTLTLLTLVAFTIALAGLTGCGAGGSTPANAAATQTTSYTVVVTGTSLTFAAPQQTVTLTIPAQ